jgi:hypothetical protein
MEVDFAATPLGGMQAKAAPISIVGCSISIPNNFLIILLSIRKEEIKLFEAAWTNYDERKDESGTIRVIRSQEQMLNPKKKAGGSNAAPCKYFQSIRAVVVSGGGLVGCVGEFVQSDK